MYCHRCGGLIPPAEVCSLIVDWLRDGNSIPVPVTRNFHSPCEALFSSERHKE